RLKAQAVRVPDGLAIPVEVTEERGPEFGDRRYALGFRKAEAAPADAPARAVRPALHLTVMKGKAVQEAYDFDAERVYLGRLEEVLDATGRVKRRNDVAFLDEGDQSQTVSREHARIAWDPE